MRKGFATDRAKILNGSGTIAEENLWGEGGTNPLPGG